MPKFIICEEVTYAVEADTAQEALDTFLQSENRDELFFVSVDERTVTDEDGEPCDVEGA